MMNLWKRVLPSPPPFKPDLDPPPLGDPPPQGTHNYLMVILDSCRWDSFVEAAPKTLNRLGEIEKRWSYASWTAPSHYNLLMGLLPHTSPAHIFASEHYKNDYLKYNQRLGTEGIEFRQFLPQLYLPTFLKHQLGYLTRAMVSMPVLNPRTLLNHDFDSYQLMPQHNNMAAMVEDLQFNPERPTFYLLNVGETHYPYATPDEDPSQWPRISGLNGVLKRLDNTEDGPEASFFDANRLEELRQRQIHSIRYLDQVFEHLFDVVPKNTYITVTADHGELFGEGGYFGHGPILHDKVFEVPFLEGKLR